METTCIRVGNAEYARENHSYGLTTMRNRHASVEGATITFDFAGKSGVHHTIDVRNRRLAKIVQQCLDLPGYELFQYLDQEGQRHSVDSTDVNAYLHEITGEHFTAKDFRTWAGTVLAAMLLREFEPFESQTQGEEKRRGGDQDRGEAPGQHAERLPQVLHPSRGARSLLQRHHAEGD